MSVVAAHFYRDGEDAESVTLDQVAQCSNDKSEFVWNSQPTVLSADGLPLGVLQAPLNPNRRGLLRATASQEVGRLDLSYLGPDGPWLV